MLWVVQLATALAALGSAHAYPENSRPDPPIVRVPAPSNCKRLPIDSDWPSVEVLNAELPGWEPWMPNQKLKHPDYIYDVKTVASVQKAVRFAAKYNIRISIINSGHDFLGR
jgi:hypothetical protein